MKHLTKVIVVCAFIAAALYAGRRLQQCRVIGVPVAAAAVAAGTAAPAGVPQQVAKELIFPDPESMTALKLGYEVFSHAEGGGMIVLPLPPGTAFPTTLALVPQAAKLTVGMSDPRCASAVLLKAYRAEQAKPIAEARLEKAGASGQLALDLASLEGKRPLLLTVELDANAESNWYCNVGLAWAN